MHLRRSLGDRLTIGLGLASVALALFTAAAAADTPKFRFTAADQAAARATAIQRADFASAPGWKGGAVKPDLSDSGPLCAGFDPKESDLVVTGAAESKWTHTSSDQVDSAVNVFRTAAMTTLDWNRNLRPNLASCLAKSMNQELGAKGRVVSSKRVAFPRVTPRLAMFRVVVAYTGSSGREILDIIILAQGRTEIFFSVMASGAELAGMQPFELHFVNAMVARIKA